MTALYEAVLSVYGDRTYLELGVLPANPWKGEQRQRDVNSKQHECHSQRATHRTGSARHFRQNPRRTPELRRIRPSMGRAVLGLPQPPTSAAEPAGSHHRRLYGNTEGIEPGGLAVLRGSAARPFRCSKYTGKTTSRT